MASRNPSGKQRRFDRIDRNILRILQREGRISYTELADRVGLSTTPCMERVKRLEKDGVIEGYHARINPEALQYSMLVFVEISLSYQSPDAFERFNQAVSQLPYLLECHLVSGDADYLIKARISDMSQYRELLGDMLLTLPGVKNSKSYIVMEEVKETSELPVEQ
ncbi:MAG: Lrp/AsnC ligand binding domain-containing protein [Marinobacterium sp.]|nr:Lrp/AsnC ligand binding domain-containing protein [Marinobacterium sp.]